MRLRNLWTIPVSILLLAACSSEMVTDSATPREGTDAVSYARLNVNLPTVPATRAYTPDAGNEAEYQVKGDPRIFIFEKGTATTENDYTFLYEAQPTEWIQTFDNTITGGDTTTGTTTTHEYQGTESFIVKLNTKARDLYALVVLNGANILPPYANEKFGDYNASLIMMTDDSYNDNYTNYVGNTTNGFVMANAANSVSAGAAADPTVLVPLTPYNSPAAATATGAGNTVFVERSAVKVTVRSPKSEYLFLSDNTVKIKPLKWALTNTNKFMYPFHRVDGLKSGYGDIWTLSRFLGNISYEGFRRTMWATDPNYAMDLTTAEACKQQVHVATAGDVWADFSTTANGTVTYHPLYCAENTFDIAHMMKGQTTAVVVMAQITGYSQTPWTPRNDPAAKPRFSRAVGTRADATDEATDDDRYYVEGKVYNTDGMLSKVAAMASDAFGVTVQPKNIVLTSILEKKAATTLTADNFKDLKTAAGADFTPSDAQLKVLNAKLGAVTGYKGGICYYIAYIRHFDDAETPWQSGEDRYGGDNAKYLGRYGVVRNNWYDLSIQDFAYPGSPDIPTPDPEDPDDDNSTIILSVKVNPWAKETTRIVPLE